MTFIAGLLLAEGGARLAAADAAAELTAGEPALVYSTYLGGSSADQGQAIVARGGTAWVAGTTNSINFPTFMVTVPPRPDEFTNDVFVAGLDSDGTVFFSTHFALGENNEFVAGLGVGPEGDVYVAGTASFGGDSTVSVVKLFAAGQPVLWRRELFGRISARGFAVDALGNAYVTGFYNEEIEVAPDIFRYAESAFAWKLDPDGATIYFVLINGSGFDVGEAIAVDASGTAWVIGETTSTDLPGIDSDESFAGNGFVTRLDPAGTILSTIALDGPGQEIERHPDGTLFVAGPAATGLFLTRLGPGGERISSQHFEGGVAGLAVDSSGVLLAVASSGSPLGLPGCGASHVVRLDATGSRVVDAFCVANATIGDVAMSGSGHAYLTGSAGPGLPLVHAWQPFFGGGPSDAFAAKVALDLPPDCSGATASPAVVWPPNGRMVPVEIAGVTDPEGDPVSIVVTGITQDEPLAGGPAATGVGTSTARVKAERSGGGDGRVYHVTFEAADPQGAACTGSVTVCVPHDRRPGVACRDGGALFDTTGG